MGLLDDAIREHLELKRKHGADPDDVARQEREALGPGQRNEFAQPDAAPADVALPAVVVALVTLVAVVAAPAVRDDLVALDEPAVFPPHATAARANPATRLRCSRRAASRRSWRCRRWMQRAAPPPGRGARCGRSGRRPNRRCIPRT